MPTGVYQHRKGYNFSEETKEKLRKANRGKHFSPSTEFKKGHENKYTEEWKKKIVESRRGYKHNEATKKKLSEIKRGKPTWASINRQEMSEKLKSNLPKTIIKNGQHLSRKTEFKKGNKSWIAGKHIKINDALIKWRLNGGKLTKEQERIRAEKTSIALKGRKLKKEHIAKISGENASNWKGGITPKNILLKASRRWREWRQKVFEYDNYTCWICEEEGGELHPHHLKKFSDYPRLRFKVSNGLTLCEFCHRTYTNFRR